MYTHTKFDHQFDHGGPPSISYVVCSTPRCGSSLLCEALCLTGFAGAPTEFFDDETRGGFCRKWGLAQDCPPDEYLKALLEKKTGPIPGGGVFGFKAHFHQYRSTFGLDEIPGIIRGLKFIWIQREDVVAQAVSYHKAIETNQWAVTHQSTNDSPQYSFEAIEKLRRRIEREQQQWNDFFQQHDLNPKIVSYPAIAQDPYGTAVDCLRWMGIEPPPGIPGAELTLRKQSNAINVDWIARYLAALQMQNVRD